MRRHWLLLFILSPLLLFSQPRIEPERSYRMPAQTTRGKILLKNVVWGSLSGLVIGTVFGLQQNENELPARNVVFFSLAGSSIGLVTGLLIGTVKAVKRKDDIAF